MSQIFHPAANAIARFVIAGALCGIATLSTLAFVYIRSDYFTHRSLVQQQPIPFSHAHHVSGLGIQCQYCHTTVEVSKYAGIPNTETCMSCHSQIWTNAAYLAPLRESLRTGSRLRWIRVNDLPDYVFFNHSIHIKKGIGCESCHGRVDKMPLTSRAHSLQMGWCLDCHRDPGKFIRPRAEVYTMGYIPNPKQEILGPQLVAVYDAKPRTDCDTCHR